MRKISVSQALYAGWIRYKNKAGIYTAFGVFSIVVSLVIAGVAGGISSAFQSQLFLQNLVTSLIAGVGGAYLSIGYAHFAKKDQLGEEVEFGDFFGGLRIHAKQLLVVSVVTIIIGQLGLLLLPADLLSYTMELQDQADPEEMMMIVEDMVAAYQDHSVQLVVLLLLQIVIGLAFMFAPYAASLEGKDPLEAIKWSATHAGSNFLRIVAMILILSVIAVVGAVFTLGLGLLVIIPYFSLVTYDMYTQLLDEPEILEAQEGAVESALEVEKHQESIPSASTPEPTSETPSTDSTAEETSGEDPSTDPKE